MSAVIPSLMCMSLMPSPPQWWPTFSIKGGVLVVTLVQRIRKMAQTGAPNGLLLPIFPSKVSCANETYVHIT